MDKKIKKDKEKKLIGFIKGDIPIQTLLSFFTGAIFLLILLGIATFSMVSGKQIPDKVMVIFQVILALTGAAFAAILGGRLDIKIKFLKVTIQATSAMAVFAIIYCVKPATIVETTAKNGIEIKKLVSISSC